MPRTALTVTSVQNYLSGISGGVVSVLGDAANDHSIDISTGIPRLAVIAINTGGGAITFTVDLPASSKTYNTSTTKTITVPAAVAGAPGVNFIPLDDYNALVQTGQVAHLSSTDLTTTYFVVVTWNPPIAP